MKAKESYILKVLVHPIDSFWEMKFQKKAKRWIPPLLTIVYFLATIFERQLRAFSFNEAYNTPLDLMYQIRIVILPVVLFCVSNWAVTTLMDGKGTMRDVFMVVAYSLVPLIIFKVLGAVISGVLSLNEDIYLYLIDGCGILWFAIILVVGIMTVHQYSFKKMLATMLLTVAAAAIVIFVVLLFFNLFSEIFGFIYTIYRELTLRI